MKTFLILLIIPLIVLAIDSISPDTLCDRFVTSTEQKTCKVRIEKMHPDSYLAAACQKQFDDSSFWECLELGDKIVFNPTNIDSCFIDELNDQQRINCLKEKGHSTQAGLSTGYEFQRLPASADAKATK